MTGLSGFWSIVGWLLALIGYGFAISATVHLCRITSLQIKGMRMMREDPQAFEAAKRRYEGAMRESEEDRKRSSYTYPLEADEMAGTAPEINAATAKIDEQVYLMNYRDHYADILGDHITPSRLAELFLFRAWTTQFGYRVFSSDAEASERLIGETVNSSQYLGLGMFEHLHGFAVEGELGADFILLIEDRWGDYDDVVVSIQPEADRLPTIEIMTALTKRLDIADVEVTYKLSIDFLAQLDFIKRTAMEIGILGK